MTQDRAAAFAALRSHFQPVPDRLGVAVSGGSDSRALLHLLAGLAAETPLALHVATVDHGLRPEARGEAEHVAHVCAGLGLPHTILDWRGWDGRGNLQSAARQGRYGLLADWAAGQGLSDIALGHTATDQAETLLMRLGRAAGVDGLSGMQPRRRVGGVTFHRPFLSVSRATLRQVLKADGISWIDDPSNTDPAYQRIRLRKALPDLAALGLGEEALSDSAANLADARAALSWAAGQAAREVVAFDRGVLQIDVSRFANLPVELSRRLLAQGVRWVSGAPYAPRRAILADALRRIPEGGTCTLSGCLLRSDGRIARLFREYRAVAETSGPLNAPWDDRWQVFGPDAPGREVRALGEDGLAQLTDWRAAGLPRAALLSSPAVWDASTLVAAPLAEPDLAHSATLLRDAAAYHAAFAPD